MGHIDGGRRTPCEATPIALRQPTQAERCLVAIVEITLGAKGGRQDVSRENGHGYLGRGTSLRVYT